jgi:polyisoprenoid-binding protein YceI
MDTGIDRRDRNMRAMFGADHFPRILADFPRVESSAFAAARSGGEGQIDFRLTIRDVTHPVAATVSHWAQAGDGASFDAEFEISLESYGLEVPAVLGLLRVKDIVSVRAHVTLALPTGTEGAAIAPSRPPGSRAIAS